MSLAHLVVKPYDPSMDYQAMCAELFGDNKCLVMLEKKGGDHCHVQGYLQKELSAEAWRNFVSAWSAVHQLSSEDGSEIKACESLDFSIWRRSCLRVSWYLSAVLLKGSWRRCMIRAMSTERRYSRSSAITWRGSIYLGMRLKIHVNYIVVLLILLSVITWNRTRWNPLTF
eukprot:765750-Hanusia_phi.AAC.2